MGVFFGGGGGGRFFAAAAAFRAGLDAEVLELTLFKEFVERVPRPIGGLAADEGGATEGVGNRDPAFDDCEGGEKTL